MTTGAPKIAVIAFKGKEICVPGSCEITSQVRIKAAPSKRIAGKRILWFEVFKRLRDIWGMAIPTKAIGPQNAVMVPAIKQVAITISVFVLISDIPMDLA